MLKSKRNKFSYGTTDIKKYIFQTTPYLTIPILMYTK
jgi:hypothetical protein